MKLFKSYTRQLQSITKADNYSLQSAITYLRRISYEPAIDEIRRIVFLQAKSF